MSTTEPVTELDTRFSADGVTATGWAHARDTLAAAELFWLSTVRADGRPHVTPLPAVWLDDALYFSTGPSEQKAKNLAGNPNVVLVTGCNRMNEGLDLVVEGAAVRATDEATLRRLADAYEAKYGSFWRYDVRDGAFHHANGEGVAHVYQVAPVKAFAFAKGEFGQTRYRFAAS